MLDKIAIEQKLTALDERLVYASVKPILGEFTQYAELVSKYLKEMEHEA